MNNFNLELFNMALNFDKGSPYQSNAKMILLAMKQDILEIKTHMTEEGVVTHTDYLLLSSQIVTVTRLPEEQLVATIRPAFPVKTSSEKIEDIFGKRWIPFTGKIQLVKGDKVKTASGREMEIDKSFEDLSGNKTFMYKGGLPEKITVDIIESVWR